jgi:uncharacterized protein
MTSETRSAQELANLQLARRFYAALFSADWDGVKSCIGPDFAVIEADGMPYRGTWKGFDGFMDLFGQMSTKFFEGLELQEKAVTATDDYILAFFTLSGTARPTGRKVHVEILERMDVKDGRIDKIRPFYWDTAAMARAFGE